MEKKYFIKRKCGCFSLHFWCAEFKAVSILLLLLLLLQVFLLKEMGRAQTGTFPSSRTGKKCLYHSEAIGHRVHRRPSDLSQTLTVHFCHISAGLFCPIRLIYSFGCLLDGVRHEIDSNQVIGCDASGPCGRWRRCEMRPVRLASTYTDIFLNGETGNVQI